MTAPEDPFRAMAGSNDTAGAHGEAGLDEEELLAQAAAGLAQRRAQRGDMVGAMIWTGVASMPFRRTDPPAEEDRFDGFRHAEGR